ncbi:MAG: MFS transporter, partial [Dongiaceae bacterium]
LVRAAAFFLFASAPWALLPLIVRQELAAGPEVYGILLACIGAGAVGGAVLLPRVRGHLSRDQLVAMATLVLAGVGICLALVRDVPLLAIAMLLGGGAWIAVVSSLQVAAQTAVPAWVRARALAVFIMVFFGAMAGGSALWGAVAGATDLSTALVLASAGAALGIAATWRFRLGTNDIVDHAPSMHWPAPVVDRAPARDRGPVMTTIEYLIEPEDIPTFGATMEEMRRMRRRDGALSWGLFQDAADQRRFVEFFVDESWLEHLRHHERVSVADREIQERVRALHRGTEPPRVNHWLAGTEPVPAAVAESGVVG